MRVYVVTLVLVCACAEQGSEVLVPPLSSSAAGQAGSPSTAQGGSRASSEVMPLAGTHAASVGAPAQAGRAGAPVMGGAGAAADGDADAGSADAGSDAPPRGVDKPPCLMHTSQLVVVGDSYLSWLTHDFPNDLQRELGHDYRLYAEPGASMASGGIATLVPDQLAAALADDPDVIAGIMTGGGNDILLSDVDRFPGSDECKDRADSPSLKVCQDVVATAVAAARKLIEMGSRAGIEDVIYIYYPHIPGSLLGIFALHPNEILDYAMPMARALCDQTEARTNGAMRCHFLDLQPIFAGHPEWFADDGIHENAAGSAVIAREVVKLMKAKCMAQPAESGCCAP